MVELRQEQKDQLELLNKKIQEIYTNISDENVQKSYYYFKLLWENFVKEGIFFKIKKKDQDKTGGADKLLSLFKGNGEYYATTIYNPKEVGNSMGGEHLEFSIEKKDRFYFHIPIHLFENSNVKSVLSKYITLNNFDKNKFKYFNSIKELKEEYLKFNLYLEKSNINIEKISYDNFVADLTNRIEQIKSNILIKDNENSSSKPKTISIQNNNSNNILQNKKQIILYGPPGTGKTYNSKQIIYNYNKEQLISYEVERKEIEENYFKIDEDGRIKFITFHQSYAYEEFIEGLKPIEGKKESELDRDYHITSGLFKEFVDNIINETIVLKKFSIKEKENFDFAIDKLIEIIKNKNEITCKTTKGNLFKVTYRNGKTFRISPESTNKQEIDYPANIENIKALYFKTKDKSEMYNSSYVNGILNYMFENKLLIENKKEEFNIFKNLDKIQRKELFKDAEPYFLIIDEINRGNISKIFGELITLIENDKRLGEDNELIAELPYSNEKFGIPPNLYIIATMNTSDKSIATLDLALRRRFGFIEMLPKPEVLKNNLINGINLTELLLKLNQRIEYLLDKDHLIGHSYFLKINDIDKLKEVFFNEVIPLLEEYFYGNYSKLKLVLGENFFETKINNKEYLNKLFNSAKEIDELTDNEPIYRLKTKEELNDDFEQALKNILGIENNNHN